MTISVSEISVKISWFRRRRTTAQRFRKRDQCSKKEFEIKTTSDKTMPGNEMEFTLKFNKIENEVSL
jgi:hypothetical protein